jgi:hypothetical protein
MTNAGRTVASALRYVAKAVSVVGSGGGSGLLIFRRPTVKTNVIRLGDRAGDDISCENAEENNRDDEDSVTVPNNHK